MSHICVISQVLRWTEMYFKMAQHMAGKFNVEYGYFSRFIFTLNGKHEKKDFNYRTTHATFEDLKELSSIGRICFK